MARRGCRRCCRLASVGAWESPLCPVHLCKQAATHLRLNQHHAPMQSRVQPANHKQAARVAPPSTSRGCLTPMGAQQLGLGCRQAAFSRRQACPVPVWDGLTICQGPCSGQVWCFGEGLWAATKFFGADGGGAAHGLASQNPMSSPTCASLLCPAALSRALLWPDPEFGVLPLEAKPSYKVGSLRPRQSGEYQLRFKIKSGMAFDLRQGHLSCQCRWWWRSPWSRQLSESLFCASLLCPDAFPGALLWPDPNLECCPLERIPATR